MATITANVAIQQWLERLKDVTEIRDDKGNVIGIFTPADNTEAEMYARAKALFDPQEMERLAREYEGKGRPLAEIWKDLEAREAKH